MSYSEYVRDRNERLSEAQKEDLEYFCDWLDSAIVEEDIGYELRDLPDQPYSI